MAEAVHSDEIRILEESNSESEEGAHEADSPTKAAIDLAQEATSVEGKFPETQLEVLAKPTGTEGIETEAADIKVEQTTEDLAIDAIITDIVENGKVDHKTMTGITTHLEEILKTSGEDQKKISQITSSLHTVVRELGVIDQARMDLGDDNILGRADKAVTEAGYKVKKATNVLLQLGIPVSLAALAFPIGGLALAIGALGVSGYYLRTKMELNNAEINNGINTIESERHSRETVDNIAAKTNEGVVEMTSRIAEFTKLLENGNLSKTEREKYIRELTQEVKRVVQLSNDAASAAGSVEKRQRESQSRQYSEAPGMGAYKYQDPNKRESIQDLNNQITGIGEGLAGTALQDQGDGWSWYENERVGYHEEEPYPQAA